VTHSRHKTLVALLLALILFSLHFADRPPRERTGAISQGTCQDPRCHNSRDSGFEGFIDFNFPAALISNEEVGISVSLVATKGTPIKAGFQMVGVANGDFELLNIGSFSDPGPNSEVREVNGLSYFEHFGAKEFAGNDRVTYTARWKTPSKFPADSLTLYAAAVIANGNGQSSGDLVLTKRLGLAVFQDTDNDEDGFFADIDCDDDDPLINPEADEIFNNDIDENCDGVLGVIDMDQDGFHSDEDCDDNNPNINPVAREIPNNDVDENCDGEVRIIDLDDDGWNAAEDCDDRDERVNPGQEEIPDNNVDENCDGIIEITPPVERTTFLGQVVNIKNVPLPNVNIIDANTESVLATTDEFGRFELTAIGDALDIAFTKEGNSVDGLTASDIVVLARHILGIRRLDNNLAVAAGDVNDSGSVSSIDLIQIQNVILQKTDGFGNRTAWQFSPLSLRLDDSSPDTSRITAYKLGDVNVSASTK